MVNLNRVQMFNVRNRTLIKIFIAIILLLPFGGIAQFTTLLSEDFEACGEASLPNCTWVSANFSGSSRWTTTNNACVITGTYSLAVASDASYCAYNYAGNTNKIANTGFSSAGYQLLDLSFNWRCVGEGPSFDYGKVVYSVDGVTWTDVTGALYLGQAGTQTVSNMAIPAAINNDASVFIGFRWIDDGSIVNAPGFTIDDIVIQGEQMTPDNPPSPTSNSPQCLSVTITRSGSPPSPSNVIWYWQGTSCGTSTVLGSGATFTATTSGTYYIRAYNTISGLWSTGCGSVVVVVDSPLPTANAGVGGDECDRNFQFNATPSIGTGTWTQQSGAGVPTYTPDANTPNAVVDVTLYDTYVFRWTEANGSCVDFDEITVNFYEQPVAIPGSGSNECDLNYTFGATPSVGGGTWTQQSGPGFSLYSPSANSPAANVTASAYGTYIYRWTEVNGTCSDFAEITVVFTEDPISNAGPDGEECDLFHTLAATPSVGSGLWSLQFGPGLVSYFPNAASPSAITTVTAYGTYIFRWTETNGICSDFDDVAVTYYQQPISDAGTGGIACGLPRAFTLVASASVGTGTWTIFSGPGTAIYAPSQNSPTSQATVSVNGTYVFEWQEVNGICSDFDTVTVVYVANPTVSFSGLGGPHCISDTAAIPLTGSPLGGIFSGNGIVGDNFYANLAAVGINSISYTYTDTNGCSSTDAQDVDIIGLPIVYFTGLVNPYCVDDVTAAVLTGFPSGGTFSGPGIIGNTFTPSIAGIGLHSITYSYIDGNGCSAFETQSADVHALPVVTFSGLSGQYCLDDGIASLTGSPSGGVFSGNGITGNNFDPALAGTGTHSITYSYTDGSGCFNDSTTTVDVNALPIVSFSGLGSTYCVLDSGVILTGSPVGGSFTGVGISGSSFFPTIASVGTYTITYTYTDGNGCVGSEDHVVIITGVPVASFTGLSTSYCESNPGALLTGSPVGGTFSGPGISGDTFYPSLAGVGTHTIQYMYSDGGGCADSTTQSVIVNAASPFLSVDSVTTTEAACDSTCDATAEVIGSGGVSPYTYAWSTGDVGPIADSLCASTFYITVTDASGCTSSNDIMVAGPNGFMSSITSTTMITTCFGDCTGGATATGIGGIAPYTYSWVDSLGASVGGSSSSISGLCAGTYYVIVKDDSSCVTTAPFTITQPVALVPTICNLQDVTCNSACDGSATACPSGGTAPFTYLWDDVGTQTTAMATGLCAGTYRVDVTDAQGCITTDSNVVIAEPIALVATITGTTDANCDTLAPIGTASSEASGGVGTHQFVWNTTPAQTDSVATGLLAGTYTVTVTDATGCTSTATASVGDTSTMSALITDLVLSSCTICDGSATVTPVGSVSPYVYDWLDSMGVAIGKTDSMADSLCGGLHRVIVMSSVYCIRSIPADTESPLPVASFTGLSTPHCIGDPIDALVGTPSGGVFSGPGITGSDFDPTLAGAGTHVIKYLYVDGGGCADSTTQTVEVNTLPTASFTGLDTGYCVDAAAVALAGSPPGGTFSGPGISGVIFDPATAGAGTHTIEYMFTSVDGCSDISTQTVNINALPSLAIIGLDPVYCVDAPSAVLTGSPAGGTFFGTGITDSLFTPAIANIGTHGITYSYTDGKGCSQDTVQITDVFPGFSVAATGTATCEGPGSGTATAVPAGGTSPFVYQWDDANMQTTVTAIDLPSGIITVIVTDVNTCISTSSVTVVQLTNFLVEATTTDGTNGNFDGSASVTIVGGSSPFTYVWSDGQSTSLATGLIAGDYTIIVTDSNGCQVTEQVTIANALVLVTATAFTPNDDGTNDGWIIEDIEYFPEADITIFNRWGNLLFSSSGEEYAKSPWDGTYQGKKLPFGAYFYLIDLNNGDKPLTGSVTILR
ncbi:MAG: hypothetical protein COB85_01485 [Bacteroidetes bacterium]|nr:MAG: hypothetical protein COB85_01485 [Bacteroidota bacterium]